MLFATWDGKAAVCVLRPSEQVYAHSIHVHNVKRQVVDSMFWMFSLLLISSMFCLSSHAWQKKKEKLFCHPALVDIHTNIMS